MLDVNYKKKYVGTYKEITLMFLSFSIVLFVLYPRDTIQKQILSEKSNYDLSILYLKNMLKNDSSNEKLMLALAEQSYGHGNKDLSAKLLGLLYDSKDKKRRAKAYILSYKLMKNDYEYLKKKNFQKDKVLKYAQLQAMYKTIVVDGLYGNKDIEMLYKEGSFLGKKKFTYMLLQKLLHKEPQNIHLLKDGYYLSRSMGKYKEALGYVERLLVVGVDKPKKWRNSIYNLILEKYNEKDAVAFFEKESKSSKYWGRKFAEYYIYKKQYQKAVDLYMAKFHQHKKYAIKKKLFQKAIATLIAANKTEDAATLTYKYEHYFFKDAQMRVLMLKTYIAAGDVRKARRLSHKMLRGGNY